MITFKKLLIILLTIILYLGCSTKEQFYEGMYEGLKTRERIIDPKYNDKTDIYQEKDIDYKEYKNKIEKSNF